MLILKCFLSLIHYIARQPKQYKKLCRVARLKRPHLVHIQLFHLEFLQLILSSRCHASWLWTYNVKLPLIYGFAQIHLFQPTVSVPGQNPLQEQLKAYIKCHGDLEWKLKTLRVHLLTCVSVFRGAVFPQTFLESAIWRRFIFFRHFTMDFHKYY